MVLVLHLHLTRSQVRKRVVLRASTSGLKVWSSSSPPSHKDKGGRKVVPHAKMSHLLKNGGGVGSKQHKGCGVRDSITKKLPRGLIGRVGW